MNSELVSSNVRRSTPAKAREDRQDYILSLQNADSVRKFKTIAQTLLTKDPKMIGKVIEAARQMRSLPGGKDLIPTLEFLQRELPLLVEKMCSKVISRALRKNNPTMAIDRTWFRK